MNLSDFVNAVRRAAQGFASIPEEFLDLKIKDSILQQADWDEFNRKLCGVLGHDHNCDVTPDQLDQFWDNNNTFRDMGGYVLSHC